MEELLTDIIARIRALNGAETLSADELARIIRSHNESIPDNAHHYAKKHLLPYYLKIKQHDHSTWRSWNIDGETERKLFTLLKMKPRRTASGVATITVITRPHPCSSNCIYCPNDMRMPKSYLSNEPACQRAERNFFDPYLQVCSRLQALEHMGHPTDKIELIVLGGTWNDYPVSYRTWFIHELFRALNEWPHTSEQREEIRERYLRAGATSDPNERAERVAPVQEQVNAGHLTYNQAFGLLYDAHDILLKDAQSGNSELRTDDSHPFEEILVTADDLRLQQKANETARHRVVGLVIETRPDAITPDALISLRTLGCTKIQMGIQSTRPEILVANRRSISLETIERAFALVRLFGFKIHGHLMVNLVGADPTGDKGDFKTFVTDARFIPDEIKLYPCALVAGTDLVSLYERGAWRPYTEDELMDILVNDTLATPAYIRISRMIRDIGAEDILVGNKKTNLRQMVEGAIKTADTSHVVQEIRFREINRCEVAIADLSLSDVSYETSVSTEHFLQWTTEDNSIVGFLRLSLPHANAFERYLGADSEASHNLPVQRASAMIREVHVYGVAAHLGENDSHAQHQGLGRSLIERAERISRDAGYASINVISSVGTREYYRHLGFFDNGLYQSKLLDREPVSL